jgi:hypothetical protein
MSSATIRDPLADHLITPQNAALILIDYQPAQFATVRSMDPELLLKYIVSTVKTAKTFGLPIVHSTVNVASGQGKPTVPERAGLLEDSPPIDRTSINSWEDVDFVAAVRATGRRKLIFCALWTEVCMAFEALDALREGYQVYPVGRRDRRHVRRSTSRRPGACRSSRRQADQLGLARERAAARLGSPGDGAGRRSDRADRTPPTGMTDRCFRR